MARWHQLIEGIEGKPTVDRVLSACFQSGELAARLKADLGAAPRPVRQLLEVFFALEGDLVALARTTKHPRVVVRAFQWMPIAKRKTVEALRAAAILIERVEDLDPHQLLHLFNRGPSTKRRAVAELEGLSVKHRRILARFADGYLTHPQSGVAHLALCALRSVGDEASVALIDRTPPHPDEGMIFHGAEDEHGELRWNEERRSVRRCVKWRREAKAAGVSSR